MTVQYAEKPIRCTVCGETWSNVTESMGHACFEDPQNVSCSITGVSLNGETMYVVEVEVDATTTTRHMLEDAFARVVTDSVREQYGITPQGVSLLVDRRSIQIAMEVEK